MRRSGLLPLAALLALVACSEPGSSGDSADAAGVPLGSGFDFYVLALSWSPGYCASEGERANRQQCGPGTDFGFVAHGLWPQFERGWPEYCETDEPVSVPRERAALLGDIMPSVGLVRHQWKKHGTCTGLDQTDYFAVTRAAYERIALPAAFKDRAETASIRPAEVEQAFLAANPELPADAVAVTCDRRFLRDVRICMSRDLREFVSCPEVDRRVCGLETVVVPPDD